MSSFRVPRNLLVLVVCLFVAAAVVAQSNVPPLITQAIDDHQLTTLKGNTHPLARADFDQGAAPAGLPMERMWLVLKRSPEQEASLRKLLDSQQDKTSPSYHKWLTPEQFGQQFGPADADIQAVTTWLQTHGFQVSQVAKGKTVIEFSGTADTVRQTFHTSIRKYVAKGESHWANSSDPQIPTALTPVVAGIFKLHSFLRAPQLKLSEQKVSGTFVKGEPPQLTFSDGTHALGPGDYSVIYNSKPLLTQQGITGSGQAIAVVARSNLFNNGIDVLQFRNFFGLCCGPLNIVVNGSDPGDLGGGEEAEATLDATWSGAIAPDASVDFVVSASTNTADGVDLSELYIIDNNVAPIMTESFGSCEAVIGNTEMQQISALAEQAAAQGITYMVSSGDSGAAGCDNPNNSQATHAAGVNGLGSSAFTLTVGGTQFNEGSQPSTYWSTTNGSDLTSVKSYIPENAWNESSPADGLWSSGGGQSLFITKPSWQTGVPGIPATNARFVPDVSLTAAGHDPYLVCLAGSCIPDGQGNIFLYFISGTSASSPSFASVMALVNQKMNSRQGQAAYVLYRLAAAQTYSQCNGSGGHPGSSCVFLDTTVGNNSVPGLTGFSTTTGFDKVTGLGSVNITNLVSQWHTVTFSPTTSTLSLNPTTITHGNPVTVNITVTPNSGTGTPTGDVTLTQVASDRGIEGFTLISGAVNSSTNLLPGGTYDVGVHYAGDKTYAPSDSVTVPVVVQPEGSTTALSIFGFDSSGNIIPFTSEPYGNPAYLRADVSASSGFGTPTGLVSFVDTAGGIFSNPWYLDSKGTATTAQGIWNIPTGSHSITAHYFGDQSLNANDSTAVDITVTKAATKASLEDLFAGGGEGVTATVSTDSGGIAPSGTVIFFANGTQLGTPVPVSGVDGSGSIQSGSFNAAAAFATIGPPPDGTTTITATYNGDTNYSVSTQTSPDFAVISSGTITVNPGQSGTVTLTVRGLQSFSGVVGFSCTGLPAGTACSFSPATVTGHGNTTVTVTTAAASGMLSPNGATQEMWAAMGGFPLAGICLIGVPLKRRRWTVLLSGLAVAFLAAGIGCGGGGGGGGSHGNPGTSAGTYTITATCTSGSLVHTATFTLNVK